MAEKLLEQLHGELLEQLSEQVPGEISEKLSDEESEEIHKELAEVAINEKYIVKYWRDCISVVCSIIDKSEVITEGLLNIHQSIYIKIDGISYRAKLLYKSKNIITITDEFLRHRQECFEGYFDMRNYNDPQKAKILFVQINQPTRTIYQKVEQDLLPWPSKRKHIYDEVCIYIDDGANAVQAIILKRLFELNDCAKLLRQLRKINITRRRVSDNDREVCRNSIGVKETKVISLGLSKEAAHERALIVTDIMNYEKFEMAMILDEIVNKQKLDKVEDKLRRTMIHGYIYKRRLLLFKRELQRQGTRPTP